MALVAEQIAWVVHEAMRAYDQMCTGHIAPALGAMPTNGDVVNDVKFLLANPDLGDDGRHVTWMEAKLLDGWTYGEERDNGRKKHPLLKPWEDLPEEVRARDRLFRAVVVALAQS